MSPRFARTAQFPAAFNAGSAIHPRSLALVLTASLTFSAQAAQDLDGELVRLDAPSPTALPDGKARGAQISPDGQWTLFQSSSTNLVPLPGVPEPGAVNLFLRDGREGSFHSVNVGPSGELLELGSSHAMVSSDAVVTAFVSATDVPELQDSNGHQDIYVYDRLAGAIEWISAAKPLGTKTLLPNTPTVSDDGNLIAWALFEEPGLTSKVVQLAVHDRAKGETSFITPESAFLGSFGGRPLLSGDGTKLFYTESLQDVPGFNFVLKVLDLSGAGTSVMTSFRMTGGVQQLSVSHDGQRIAFVGQASDQPTPTGWVGSLFTYDFGTDSLTCITGCEPAASLSFTIAPSLSGNGRYVGYNAFGPGHTTALLPAADFDGTYLVHDTVSGVTYDMLVNPSGLIASHPLQNPLASNNSGQALSYSGRRVVFDSNATNLALPIEPMLEFNLPLRPFQRRLHDDGADLTFGPLVAGATSELEVTGASADALMLVGVSGAGQGPTATPFGLVQLAAPWTVTPLFTDASGTARAEYAVPLNATGTVLFAQGLDLKAVRRTAPAAGKVQ